MGSTPLPGTNIMKFYAYSQWDGKPPLFSWLAIEYFQLENEEHVIRFALFGFVITINWR